MLPNPISAYSHTTYHFGVVLFHVGMFDADGNGVIDFNEFAALWQYVCDWQETFRSFDLDSSGTIDRNELKAGITNLKVLPCSEGIVDKKQQRYKRSTPNL